MLHLSSSGAAKLLSGDDTENENDELNGEDIDTTWRLVVFFFISCRCSVSSSRLLSVVSLRRQATPTPGLMVV